MNQPAKRRNLLEGLNTTPPALPAEAISATAARHGFADAAPATVGDAVNATIILRRRRPPIGRNHQFNVRLREDTLQEIYGMANGRNIPVAQVIEEAIAALRGQGRG